MISTYHCWGMVVTIVTTKVGLTMLMMLFSHMLLLLPMVSDIATTLSYLTLILDYEDVHVVVLLCCFYHMSILQIPIWCLMVFDDDFITSLFRSLFLVTSVKTHIVNHCRIQLCMGYWDQVMLCM